MYSIYLISGFILLYYGGNKLVRSALTIARYYKVSPLLISTTIVSFATSAPELLVSINAAISNHADISLGNIIGSNISNLLLVLGICAIFNPIHVKRSLVNTHGVFLVSITILFTLICFSNNSLTRGVGVFLLVCLASYNYFAIHKSSNVIKIKNSYEDEVSNIWFIFFKLIISVIFLGFGAHLFVSGAVPLAQILGVSEAIIGLTIVALGTSLPEVATSIIASIKKENELALGNIIGSNIFNLLAIAGVTSIVKPIQVNDHFINIDLTFMAVCTFSLMIIAYLFKKISRLTGFCALTIYGIYVVYMLNC